MQKLTLFVLKGCPYCRQAKAWLAELVAENPAYAAVPIEEIEEREQKALADSYDYYYVPTFYMGKTKLHEGAATKEGMRTVLETALHAPENKG